MYGCWEAMTRLISSVGLAIESHLLDLFVVLHVPLLPAFLPSSEAIRPGHWSLRGLPPNQLGNQPSLVACPSSRPRVTCASSFHFSAHPGEVTQ